MRPRPKWRKAMSLVDLLTLIVVTTLCRIGCLGEKRPWKFDRQPKIHHGKISIRQLSTDRLEVQDLIVDIHNYFRSRVKPTARNMLEMSWDKEAADDADRWSRECQVLTHDNTTGRWVDNFGSCGQNIFISTHMVPWLFAIKTWWLEKELFNFGRNVTNDLSEIGHYTQLVWAASHKVGCGMYQCHMDVEEEGGSNDKERRKRTKKYFLYVCNYCPIGNFMERLGTPYQKGPPCSGCRKSCKSAAYSKSGKRISRKDDRKEKYENKKRKAREDESGEIPMTSSEVRHPLAFPKHTAPIDQTEIVHKQSVKSVDKKRKLCTNSCPVADLWVNCKELASGWRSWLCHERKDPEGWERFNNCKATCTCRGKVTN